VRRAAAEAGLPESALGKLELVLEEIVVNVARYAYPKAQPGTADVGWRVTAPGRLAVEVRDRGRAYNPLEGAPPGLEEELADRPIGGLGIFLVKRLADGASYAREGDRNVLSFRFEA
jgi:anti-sigma regulatory factor (Ser/Thr protein kinase)